MRYIWDQQDAYVGSGRLAPLKRAALTRPLAWLRQWDVATAAGVDRFIANSRHVRARIRRYYGRDACVVYPPVRVERFAPARERGDVFVCAGALVPYKRIDLAIAAFNATGRALLVVGEGPEYRRLRRAARPNVKFAGRVGDAELADVLARARALVMPMVEDFGITAVEAQAAGTPVLAYGAGGALETVRNGRTGLHFTSQSPAAINEAVARLEHHDFDPAVLRAHAARFSAASFRQGMRRALAELAPAAYPAEAAV
jgi:glycosyltransferase involved in cell wall biosynthesis